MMKGHLDRPRPPPPPPGPPRDPEAARAQIHPEPDRPGCSSPPPVDRVEDLDFMHYYLRNQWREAARMLSSTGLSPEEISLQARELWFQRTFTGREAGLSRSLLETPLYVYSLEALQQAEQQPPSSVMVLKSFLDKWGISHRLFDVDYIREKYGEHYTDIRIQTPLIQGFNLRSSRYTQEIDEMLVRDYVDYQKSRLNMSLLREDSLDQRIKFAVNLDIGNFPEQLLELRTKVPGWLYCNREGDLQSYLRRHIPGMSVPQIYLKVAGCWTGGHQENLSLRAVNINHGPGEVEWYCMDTHEAYRFNQHILQDKKLNLLKLEGLWYIPLEEVLSRGFRVSKFVQQAGDVVVLAPGTLHWVRSYSHTVNSAWNVGEFTQFQLSELYRRYEFNLDCGFRNLILVRTLTLDIFNNAAGRLDPAGFELVRDKLRQYVGEALHTLDLVGTVSAECEADNTAVNNVVMCNKCYGETFECWFYFNQSGRDDADFDIDSVLCFKCVSRVKRQDRVLAFVKYDKKDLGSLSRLLEDLTFKAAKTQKYPLLPRMASPRYYIGATVSEYFRFSQGRLSPLKGSDEIFEDPKLVLTDRNYLSRKGTAPANTFDRDALLYKIKRKDTRPLPLPAELSLNELKTAGKTASPETTARDRVVRATQEFFRANPDCRVMIGDDLFPLLYRQFEQTVHSGRAGDVAVLQCMLREDSFMALEEVDRVQVVFLYMEGVFNPQEALYISVPDDKIKDQVLLARLQAATKPLVG